MFIKRAIGLCLAVVLSACTTLSDSIKQEDLNAIDKIGIVSLVDDKVAYNYVGITIFNNEHNLYHAEQWNIDQTLGEELEKGIKERSDISTVVIPAQKQWLNSLYDKDGNYHFEVKKALPVLRQIAKGTQVRYLAVIHRSYMQFDPNVTVNVQGLGVRRQIGSDLIGAYAILEAKLIDTDTGRILSRMFTPARDETSGLPWKESFENLSEDEKVRIKVRLQKMAVEWMPALSRALVVPAKE